MEMEMESSGTPDIEMEVDASVDETPEAVPFSGDNKSETVDSAEETTVESRLSSAEAMDATGTPSESFAEPEVGQNPKPVAEHEVPLNSEPAVDPAPVQNSKSVAEPEEMQNSQSVAEPEVVQNPEPSAEPEVVQNSESESEEGIYYWRYELSPRNSPPCIAITPSDEFGKDFLKGCKWAPDGSCLLTNSDDTCLRVFNLPNNVFAVTDWETFADKDDSWKSVLKIKEGGQIYDYCFYPRMSSADPITSCFLASAADNPLHLWDAFTGSLRCSYLSYNQSEVLISPHSVAFDPMGEKIYCGFDKTVRIFDLTRPGRQCDVRKLKQSKLPDLNLSGIVSCIAVNPSLSGVYACGSFRKNIGLYLDDGTVICVLEGHLGGLTHLKFSHDGTKLFSGGRKDARLICWDLRNMGGEYKIHDRVVNTNQRVYFDITSNDRYLVTGNTDGHVRIWDLDSSAETEAEGATWDFPASSDCVNGVSMNPALPLLATGNGQRHFQDIADDDDDENILVESSSKRNAENNVKLFKLM